MAILVTLLVLFFVFITIATLIQFFSALFRYIYKIAPAVLIFTLLLVLIFWLEATSG